MLLDQDTIAIDSLSIFPGSFQVFSVLGIPIDTSRYSINEVQSILIINDLHLKGQSVIIKYVVFPFDLKNSFSKHNEKFFFREEKSDLLQMQEILKQQHLEPASTQSKLNKLGSVSRGISFGNSQDIVVNSDLNLQLEGDLGDGVFINAAITDNNIPIQPEGNTQQLQEFDKVYIHIKKEQALLRLGDIELSDRNYFLKYKKKSQGVALQNEWNISKSWPSKISAGVSASLAKGSFQRQTINQLEGNQGPYKLIGVNNETLIIILAGSERVYIDGQILKRGYDEDYTIDYNLGEITFTSKTLITKDLRIVIEFEYSDRNYARSLFHAKTHLEGKSSSVKISYFKEHDLKSQPLQQVLSDENKNTLSMIGDSLQWALIQSQDSIGFNPELIMYKKVDTTVGVQLYSPVFVYSTNKDSAVYSLRFSYVGIGKGNYTPFENGANGKVYKWLSPQNGVLQGEYEPVILMVTPKSKEMIELKIGQKIGPKSRLDLSVGAGRNNKNTFSDLNKEDDGGIAVHLLFSDRRKVFSKKLKSWMLESKLAYDLLSKNFSAFEPIRDVEFNRDWNLSSVSQGREQIPSVSLELNSAAKEEIKVNWSSLSRIDEYNGNKTELSIKLPYEKNQINLFASSLKSNNRNNNTRFLRNKAHFLHRFKKAELGFKQEFENNLFSFSSNDSLMENSYQFIDYEVFMQKRSGRQSKWKIFFKQRYDQKVAEQELAYYSRSDDAGLELELMKKTNHRLHIRASYRALNFRSDLALSDEHSVVTMLEHRLKTKSKAVDHRLFYETSTGLEAARSYIYIEVPAGQGVYTWVDYNDDGIQQQNEFEQAPFADQATFIRIIIPSGNFQKVYTTRFNEQLSIYPGRWFSSKTSVKKFLDRFINQSTYRALQKVNNPDPLIAYNPFYKDYADTSLINVNSSFKNTLFFNRNKSRFNASLEYYSKNNKALLSSGYELRSLDRWKVKTQFSFIKSFVIQLHFSDQQKSYSSEFYELKNYDISSSQSGIKLRFQPANKYRIESYYRYTYSQNDGPIQEESFQHVFGADFRYNFVGKGSIQSGFSAHYIEFTGDASSSIAYEMMQSFQAGLNSLWTVSLQRRIGENLQLSLNYNGRKAATDNIVHIGSVQLRALL